jgi:hypothetical protein
MTELKLPVNRDGVVSSRRKPAEGHYKATEYWPELHRMILARNSTVKASLKKFGRGKLD